MPIGPMLTLAALLSSATATSVSARAAESGPAVRVSHLQWRAAGGICSADIRRARVAGVADDVATRIDAILARALAAQTTFAAPTAREREAACARFKSDNRDLPASLGPPTVYESSDWTTGLARGRWLSVRLHVTSAASGAAHPSDSYVSYTFDLEHGGYPVPTNGYYTRSQRKRLNAAILVADIRALQALAKGDPGNQLDLAYPRERDAGLNVDATQILLTRSGVELTGVEESEAGRNYIITIPFSELAGVGTPGGPLDASTR